MMGGLTSKDNVGLGTENQRSYTGRPNSSILLCTANRMCGEASPTMCTSPLNFF